VGTIRVVIRAAVLSLALLAAAPAAAPAALLSSADQQSFASLSASIGGRNGVAVSPVGRAQPVIELGSLHTGVAWSTIKTGIALAAYYQGHGSVSASNQALLRSAITASDNAAAQSVWDHALGGGSHAASLVRHVLALAGDTQTVVRSRVSRPGYTAFGQTHWSLRNQLAFMAGMACVRNSAPVLSLMGQVIGSQRWGLGSAGGGTSALLKGGWGPAPSGPYLVRQMGILTLSGGRQVAVTLATIPRDGSFASGTRNLTRIARWLAGHLNASSASAQPAC
jgi:hypothetical protein